MYIALLADTRRAGTSMFAALPPGHASIRSCAGFETTKRVADLVGAAAFEFTDALASRARTAVAVRKLDDITNVAAATSSASARLTA